VVINGSEVGGTQDPAGRRKGKRVHAAALARVGMANGSLVADRQLVAATGAAAR
jgi:hypothetical protein